MAGGRQLGELPQTGLPQSIQQLRGHGDRTELTLIIDVWGGRQVAGSETMEANLLFISPFLQPSISTASPV